MMLRSVRSLTGLQTCPHSFRYSIFATRCLNLLEPLPSSPLLSPVKVGGHESIDIKYLHRTSTTIFGIGEQSEYLSSILISRFGWRSWDDWQLFNCHTGCGGRQELISTTQLGLSPTSGRAWPSQTTADGCFLDVDQMDQTEVTKDGELVSTSEVGKRKGCVAGQTGRPLLGAETLELSTCKNHIWTTQIKDWHQWFNMEATVSIHVDIPSLILSLVNGNRLQL